MGLRVKKKKEYNEIQIAAAANFPGNFISNCAIGYILFNFLFVLIFSVFCHPLFWEFLGEYWIYILIIGILAAVGLIIMPILNKILYGPNMTANTKAIAHFVELAMFFIKIIGGIAASIGRIIIGLIVMLLSQIRLDKPILPKWVLKLVYLDGPNSSYLSLVKLYVTFNNPIQQTFIQCLKYIENETPTERNERRAKKVESHRALSRLQVLWLLNNKEAVGKLKAYFTSIQEAKLQKLSYRDTMENGKDQ